jgi:IS5 family transposase
MSQPSSVEAFLPAGFGRNVRLERIAALIDWERVGRLVEPVRSGETGRPRYDPPAMVKALLLQQWHGLSDPGLEEALNDRVSFRRSCGLALDAATPDATTLCRFCNPLEGAGLGEALFEEVLGQLDRAGFVVRTGTLIGRVRSAVKRTFAVLKGRYGLAGMRYRA